MKFPIRMLCLLALAPLAQAQEAISLDQSLQFHYARFLNNQAGAMGTDSATYQFSSTMPVLGYSLGALNLGGTVDFEHYNNSGGSASAVGLDNFGASTSLFPTLPVHLSLAYSQSRSLDLGTAGGEGSRNFGAGLTYGGPLAESAQISYLSGNTEMASASEQWQLWKCDVREHFGRTTAFLDVEHGDYRSTGGGLNYANTFVQANTSTVFDRNWRLTCQMQSSDATGDGQTLFLRSDLVGTVASGRGAVMTSMVEEGDLVSGANQWSTQLSQSLSWNFGRFSAFGSVARTGSMGLLPNTESEEGSATLGGSYRLGQDWSLSGDISQSWGLGGQDSKSIHLGVAQGGEMTDVVKHALNYFSDRQFQARISEDYAPGYLPAEMVNATMQRRLRQNGAFSFSADGWHAFDAAGGATQDLARVSGDLQLYSGLRVMVIGDWRRDDGFSSPGTQEIDRDLTLNGSYRMDWASISFSAGYKDTGVGTGAGDALSLPPGTLPSTAVVGRSQFESAGLFTVVGGAPLTTAVTRMVDPQGQKSMALSSNLMLFYGKTQVRLGVQEAWISGGSRTQEFTLDLVRRFDTLYAWVPWAR